MEKDAHTEEWVCVCVGGGCFLSCQIGLTILCLCGDLLTCDLLPTYLFLTIALQRLPLFIEEACRVASRREIAPSGLVRTSAETEEGPFSVHPNHPTVSFPSSMIASSDLKWRSRTPVATADKAS